MKIKLFIVCICCFIAFGNAQIKKVEPPHWWSDMETSEIQILFYGDSLANYEVKSDGLQIIKVDKVVNPNYLFVTVNTKNVVPSTASFSFSKDGSIAFTHPYEIVARNPSSRERKGFDSSDVVYLIMPDRFANGNRDNDSHPEMSEKVERSNGGGRHGGDIQGVINNLDYIHDLGATAIWSTPLLEDNEPKYSYHTYAQSDLYRIDPRYGTNEDYKKLADEMHERDMKLIMDYVTNHWGSKHWIIQDLPFAEWIHQWPEGFTRSNYRMATQFDSYASEVDKKGCMNGWFDTTMPDMNQSNPFVLRYMIQNAIWWIEYAGLDGLRVDTYSYNDKEGIAQWTKAIMDEYPNFNIVGEVWMHDQAQISYWQKDSKIGALDNYNSNLPSVMDFTLHDAVTTMFSEDETGWDKGMIRAYDNFVNDFLYPDVNNIMVFAGNHDTNRINGIFQSDIKKYKLVLSLLLTTRGIPQLYYGDEIGMLGNRDEKGDGDIRRDFPGGWFVDGRSAFKSASTNHGRTSDQEAYHKFTKKLLNWRKEATAVHNGNLLQYIPFDNVYVYFRSNETQTVMVLINNSSKIRKLDTSRFKEGIQSFTQGTDVISDENFDLTSKITIQPKTALILDLK
ncbi:glycoside hydrolase family 13 protein [Aquimarina intermedia]|uniref:Glycosidase n=1 Tax=Aquimarina intermedia TaxID=350814 RepID=A0A5S5BYH7_9FLAO|nr:glycoside hydrolase family 13 protein [Aquimarina intermedia]TYP72211.1 glycosidase [Aquimarina intermedia]